VRSLPPMLKAAGTEMLFGTPVSAGIGWGRVLRMGGLCIPASLDRGLESDAAGEMCRFDTILARVEKSYSDRLALLTSGPEADVIKAHRSVARDPGFRREIERAIMDRGRSIAGAV